MTIPFYSSLQMPINTFSTNRKKFLDHEGLPMLIENCTQRSSLSYFAINFGFVREKHAHDYFEAISFYNSKDV